MRVRRVKIITRVSSIGSTSGSRLPRRLPTGQSTSPSRAFPNIWGRRSSFGFIFFSFCPVRYILYLQPDTFHNSFTRVFKPGLVSSSQSLPFFLACALLPHLMSEPLHSFLQQVSKLAERGVLKHVSCLSVGIGVIEAVVSQEWSLYRKHIPFSSLQPGNSFSSSLFPMHPRLDRTISGYCNPLFMSMKSELIMVAK